MKRKFVFALAISAMIVVGLSAVVFHAGATCLGPDGPCYPTTETWACGMSAMLPCQLPGNNPDGTCPIETDPMTCTFEAMTFTVGGGEIMASYNRACNPAVSDCVELTPWHHIAYKNAITDIVIENGVEVIGANAFLDLPNVTTITLGANVRLIFDGAFAALPNLTSITSFNPVPPEIQGAVSCQSCMQLDPDFCGWEPPCPLPTFALRNHDTFAVADDFCLYVPAESVDAYKNDWLWKRFPCIEPLSANSVRPRGRSPATPRTPARVTVRNRTLYIRGLSSDAVTQINLINMRGRLVANFSSRGDTTFSLSDISAGRYFVDVNDGTRRDRTTVVVGSM